MPDGVVPPPDLLFVRVNASERAPDDIVVLHGWVGETAEGSSTVRLYLRFDGSQFVDIDRETIIHSEQLPYGNGTLVWVPKDERLSPDIMAEFLTGGIADERLSVTEAFTFSGPPLAPGPVYYATIYCWPKK